MPAPRTGKFEQDSALRTLRRLIDTWVYNCGIPGQAPLEVKIHMTAPAAGKFLFVATCSAFANPREHGDLNVLREQVDALLQDWCTDRSDLKWADWLEVSVTGRAQKGEGSQEIKLSIAYRTLPRATLADGKAVTVTDFGRVIPFPEAHTAHAELEANELILSERNSGTEISYIPATPSALAALHGLQSRLDQLRLALSAMLAQESIASKIDELANCALALPAPKD